MKLLAIDPGINTGYAMFKDGHLAHCGLLVGHVPCADLTIIEKPVIYPTPRQKGDPNDLINLAILVGKYVGEAERNLSRVLLIAPHTWKGSVPKKIHQGRILDSLSAGERRILESAAKWDHNVVDAVGFGRWYIEQRAGSNGGC